ncbi:RelA/SpoT family protein [Brevibacillus dissolubilis]|uniref:RelA/SpoT family protein n=1 Tax=Brevibacillus dissolubilis TaxID=1844116 RepID=UPI001115E032|nr:bifunctional (p)ppGpp synthetase/guanosine-3',5'-bis(diphosphate) 3'-pyrophosphohydrolase [Brevibacillus dissolubilis]
MNTGIDEIIKKASSYLSPEDVDMVERAYQLATKAHEGQIRKSGVPYIMHPIAVAGILTNLQMDAVTIAAGFLHDVVEDTEVTLDQLRQEFGADVALLVDGVTKLEKIKYKSKEEQLAENHRKMLVAMAQDIRVILIKLADRLHNMRTLKHMSEEKQREISNETMEIFVPLAHRLGIASVKWELEDISLRYLNPQQYYRIVNLMQKKRTEREAYITEANDTLQEKLAELHIQAEVSGRPKHIYSIYKKMATQNKQFNEIYDLLALRVIVNDIRDCYAVLGIVHTLWKPMPGRFKDYIAMPKPNMYQSLHTTVIGPKGEPLEVQIRTWDMHRTAEIGIAAHWAYKEGKGQIQGSFEEKIGNIREIIQGGHEENSNAQEFMENLKQDLFSDMVFVFTPKGDVVELPKGSVPIDFAYRIHSAVGNRTIGAKINGKIVPLDHALRTGDIIEIITSKHSYGPSQDWLKIAKSVQARNKIKQWFKKEKREENVAKGLNMVEMEIKARGFDIKEVLSDENLKEASAKFNFQAEDDMYAAVGYGGLTAAQVVSRLTEKLRRDREEQANQIPEFKAAAPQPARQGKSDYGVRVKGVDNLLVRLSRCCTPVPGDDIIGFITRGRGVSVHRRDCPNVETGECAERLIPVDWEGDQKQNYNVDIEITGHDRGGLLNDVLQVVGETKTNITAVSGRADKNRVATINMTISISNIDHLQKVVERIKRIKDIYSVRRILNT